MMIKRDPLQPTRLYVEPPLYGNYQPQGRNLMRDKLQHMPGADHHRSNEKSQREPSKKPSPGTLSWRARIPPGTDVCLQLGRGSLSSSSPNRATLSIKYGRRQKVVGGNHDHQQGQSQNEILRASNKEKAHSRSPGVPPPSPSISPRSGRDKKQFFNVMWDPRVARGSTMVQFGIAQRAKCKHDLDLNGSMLFRYSGSDNKSRRRRGDDSRSSNNTRSSNTRSSSSSIPSRRNFPPDVKIIKEPLSYSSFAPFLTEATEISFQDRGQCTAEDDPVDPSDGMGNPPRKPDKKHFSSGVSKNVQAEIETESSCIEANRSRTEWIVSTLRDKIPEQALLEVTEEMEINPIRGIRHGYEMESLYRKWAEMKEAQWNEWLEAWSKIRMEEIEGEERLLESLEERLAVIGFSRNAISYCYCRLNETMKTDGFLDKATGLPFDELKKIEKFVKHFEDEAKKDYFGKEIIAREVVDSTIVRAAVHRFGHHMHDKFGKPHGQWLSRKKQEPRDFDEALERYLEMTMIRRKRNPGASVASIDSDFDRSDSEFFDQTTEIIPEIVQHESPRSSLGKPTYSYDAPQRSRSGSPLYAGSSAAIFDGNAALESDVDIIFKRKTSWAVLDKEDEKRLEKEEDERLSTELEVDKLKEIQGGENGTLGDDNTPP